MAIDWMETGRRVHEARIRAAMTQKQLAVRFGLSHRSISDIERGRILRPSERLLEAVRVVLGSELPEIGDATPKPAPSEIVRVQRQIAHLAAIVPPALWSAITRILDSIEATGQAEHRRLQQEQARREQMEQDRSQHLGQARQRRHLEQGGIRRP